MNKNRMLAVTLVAGSFALASATALAYGTGDIFFRAGYAKTDSRSSLNVVDPGVFDEEIDIGDSRGVTFGAGFLFHDNLGVELSSSQRVSHDAVITGLGVDTSFKRLPVNLMVNYYPLGGLDSRVQPYLGAGLNYTRFSGEPEGVEMRRTYALVGQMGIDLAITDNLLLNGFGNYADVESRVHFEGENLGKARLDPLTIGGGLTLRF